MNQKSGDQKKRRSAKKAAIEILPDEVLLKVFGFMDATCLKNSALVSKK